ncbi:MAG: hypothetical protein QMD01_03200, partial [Thermodesulfovibrionales bacterium]|nr:hypothetical protein [Thermodesulfovibrionales bacterium]
VNDSFLSFTSVTFIVRQFAYPPVSLLVLIVLPMVAVPGFKETTPLALTASLSGFIGLALGSYLFLEKGIKEVLTRA